MAYRSAGNCVFYLLMVIFRTNYYHCPGPDTGDMSKDLLMDSKPPPRERTGFLAPCLWFKEAPLRRWQFLVMCLPGIATILWIVLKATSSITGEVLCGLSACLLAGYGSYHFKILLGLKENVDRYRRSNESFKLENGALNQEVSKLERAAEQLAEINSSLKATTRAYEVIIEIQSYSIPFYMSFVFILVLYMDRRISSMFHFSFILSVLQ